MTGSFGRVHDLYLDPAMSPAERQAVLSSVIEAYGLRDFATGKVEREPSAPLAIEIRCAARAHPRSVDGPPVLARVYATTGGPLFVTNLTDRYAGPQHAIARGLVDEGPGEPGSIPNEARIECRLLARPGPDELMVQCRKHSFVSISRSALLARCARASAEGAREVVFVDEIAVLRLN